MSALNASASVKLPLLVNTAPLPIWNTPVLAAVLVQVVSPLNVTLRPTTARLLLPLSASVPPSVVLPLPFIVPPVHTPLPLVTRLPVPPMVPLLISKPAAVATPLALNVPPLAPSVPARSSVPLAFTVPPDTVTRPVPGPVPMFARLCVPPEKFSVAPAATARLPPLLLPPPPRFSWPLFTASAPLLSKPMLMLVVPAPVLVYEPALAKMDCAPPKSLLIELLNASWSLKLPLLDSLAPLPVWK